MIRLDTVLAPLNPAPRVTSRAVENPTKTATITYSPTAINVDTGIIPTPPPPTPTVVSLDAATRTASTCQRPQGWTTYTVQAGNTLFAIALATNSTVDELRYVNCIANVDNIIVGDVLFVPRKPAQPIRTPMPSLKRDNLYVLGCSDARTLISNLQVAQTVAGVFNVYGSAFRDDFWYYKIEIRPDWANVYNFFSRSDAPVNNGVLTSINPALFGEGLHWIRLSVVNRVANVESDAVCEIPVIFG
jgi:LysM repeat protein